jgi:phosphoserine phosphatase
LEAKPAVDRFIGFGRYTVRERVRAGADAFIMRLAELPGVIDG